MFGLASFGVSHSKWKLPTHHSFENALKFKWNRFEYIAELTANPLEAHLCEKESDLLLQRFNTLRVSQSHRRECAITKRINNISISLSSVHNTAIRSHPKLPIIQIKHCKRKLNHRITYEIILILEALRANKQPQRSSIAINAYNSSVLIVLRLLLSKFDVSTVDSKYLNKTDYGRFLFDARHHRFFNSHTNAHSKKLQLINWQWFNKWAENV